MLDDTEKMNEVTCRNPSQNCDETPTDLALLPLADDANGRPGGVIQAPKPEPRIMRYELRDYEWAAIKPMLPNKPRGVPRVNDRRVLNGIFWVLRSGAP